MAPMAPDPLARDNREEFDNLLLEHDASRAVTCVTINRPQVLNALNRQTLDELERCFARLKGDDETRAVVLTGAGTRAFVAGADINELAVQTPTSARVHVLFGQRVLDGIEHLGKPVVAAVNGLALGGGCELAMACTLRVAADSASFGQPEIALGLLPGYAGTQRLARLVGKGRALEMMLTGRPVSAADAERMGLVNRVVPAGELMQAATALAAQLAGQPRIAVEYILAAVNQGLEMSFEAACEFEATLFGLVSATEDMREGTRAFLEKRKPVFKGR